MAKADDKARTHELMLRVWAEVARNKLLNEELPDAIPVTTIEGHRGRQGKAIRLLDDIVSYAGERNTSKYSTYSHKVRYYRVHKFDLSEEYAEQTTDYPKTWDHYHHFMYIYSHRDDMALLGYKDIKDLNDASTLYVYWHQDEYDIIKEEDHINVYPKALLETRLKALLRAIVEEHVHTDYTRKLERYLDLPENSLKEETSTLVSIRNYTAEAGDFTRERYEGSKGYLEELKHYRDYYQAQLNDLERFVAIVHNKGGYAKIVEEMRKDSIQQILHLAPLHITATKKEDEGYHSEMKAHLINKYLLAHADYFDYDILYGEDTSIGYIHHDKIDFEPPEDELKLIDADKKRGSKRLSVLLESL